MDIHRFIQLVSIGCLLFVNLSISGCVFRVRGFPTEEDRRYIANFPKNSATNVSTRTGEGALLACERGEYAGLHITKASTGAKTSYDFDNPGGPGRIKKQYLFYETEGPGPGGETYVFEAGLTLTFHTTDEGIITACTPKEVERFVYSR